MKRVSFREIYVVELTPQRMSDDCIVEPDQALTIQQIITRMAQGLPTGVGSSFTLAAESDDDDTFEAYEAETDQVFADEKVIRTQSMNIDNEKVVSSPPPAERAQEEPEGSSSDKVPRAETPPQT